MIPANNAESGQPQRPRILVAGIGNIFLGDDAFGVEVAQRLARRALPDGVRVIDFGIRGLDLTYALLDGYDIVILVDAAPRGLTPGTVFVMKPEVEPAPESDALVIQGHDMDPVKVLRAAARMGAQIEHVLVVGCEPSPPESEEQMQMGLSEPVQAAVDEALVLIELLVGELLRGNFAVLDSCSAR